MSDDLLASFTALGEKGEADFGGMYRLDPSLISRLIEASVLRYTVEIRGQQYEIEGTLDFSAVSGLPPGITIRDADFKKIHRHSNYERVVGMALSRIERERRYASSYLEEHLESSWEYVQPPIIEVGQEFVRLCEFGLSQIGVIELDMVRKVARPLLGWIETPTTDSASESEGVDLSPTAQAVHEVLDEDRYILAVDIPTESFPKNCATCQKLIHQAGKELVAVSAQENGCWVGVDGARAVLGSA